MKKSALILLLLVGCGRTADRGWVLSSYDAKIGYVFTKDGVAYQTNCVATGTPMAGDKPDLSPDALPPFPALGHEEDCTEILAYLHKPISVRQVDGAALIFDIPQSNHARLEFLVKHAQ